MADGKNSFILYADCKESVELLSDEKAGQLFKHILRYVSDENPVLADTEVQLVFIPIKQSLKRDLKKWEKYIEKQSENGKKGGRPSKNEEPKETQKTQAFFEKPKKADSVNVSVSVNDSVNDSVSEETRTPHDECIYEEAKTKEYFFSSFEDGLIRITCREKSCTIPQAEALRQKFWDNQHDLGKTKNRQYGDLRTHYLAWVKYQKIETGNGTGSAKATKRTNKPIYGKVELDEGCD